MDHLFVIEFHYAASCIHDSELIICEKMNLGIWEANLRIASPHSLNDDIGETIKTEKSISVGKNGKNG